MTAYVMSSWWGTIFDKSHREVIIMGDYFIQKELLYGPGDIIKGVIIFVRAVSIF